jgi:hypothetical protein
MFPAARRKVHVISVMIVVMIVIGVIVAPVPIFLLFTGRNMAEIAIRVAVRFSRPLVVIHHLTAVPGVIVRMVGIVNPVVALRASSEHYRAKQ